MKLVFAATFAVALIGTALSQQQGPFAPRPGPAGANQPTAAQTTTPANQGVATNPTGDTGVPTPPGLSTTDPTSDPTGGIARSPLGTTSTNQIGTGTSPLFLNVTATTITDANGSPI